MIDVRQRKLYGAVIHHCQNTENILPALHVKTSHGYCLCLVSLGFGLCTRLCTVVHVVCDCSCTEYSLHSLRAELLCYGV
jgi:hypothetical protein